jgi:hypothetical protein
MDGVNKVPNLPADSAQNPIRRDELKNFPRTAEDFVLIANRLAAQSDKQKTGTSLDALAGKLRDRLGH